MWMERSRFPANQAWVWNWIATNSSNMRSCSEDKVVTHMIAIPAVQNGLHSSLKPASLNLLREQSKTVRAAEAAEHESGVNSRCRAPRHCWQSMSVGA